MQIKKLLIVTTLVCVIAAAGAAYEPPDGGEEIYHLYSPFLLAGGTSVTSTGSPYGDTYNPAASGATQRTTLDLSYAALTKLTDPAAYTGTVINLGASFPSRVGVFTGSAHFLSSANTGDDTGLPLGTLGGMRFSFAKDLYPHILVGAGLNFTIGSNETFDWGLGADLGFIHLAGDLGILKDFRWGIAMQNMGKWYAPVEDPLTAYPSPFTPAIGLGFSLIKTEDVDWAFTTDFQFPSFQNVRMDVGTSFTLFDTVTLYLSTDLDVQSLIIDSYDARSFPLAGGISFTIKTDIKKDSSFISERGWNRSEIKPVVAIAPLQNDIIAMSAGVNLPLGQIDVDPPEISVTYENVHYISPNNDGTSDNLILPIDITDERYIKGYNLKIFDADGTLVQEIRNKEKRPETQTFKNVVDRFFSKKSGIVIPEELRWDGTAEGEKTVSDGTYAFVLEAWDDNGNQGVSAEYTVIVDTTYPSVQVEKPEQINLIFSPNGDGNKDTIPIEQSGSNEDLWKAEIVSTNDTVMRTVTWESESPQPLEWDGKNNAGEFVPDGAYTYRITSTDRAGNTTTESIENIIKNTQETPLTVAIDSADFSPNGDGIRDEVTFDLDIPVKQGIVSWEVQLKNSKGAVVESHAGTDEIPERYTFKGTDKTGNPLPEDTYHAVLSLVYQNGNNPVADSPPFTLDLTEPSARIIPQDTIFSPNSDGNKEEIVLTVDGSREDTWSGRLVTEAGTIVRSYSWSGVPDKTIRWDGTAEDGTLMPDGTYELVLESTDRAGNSGVSNRVVFELNTVETPIDLAAGDGAFSPNNDGRKDTITLLPDLEVEEGVDSWELQITAGDGSTVKRFAGTGKAAPQLEWDGRTETGVRSDEGEYYALLTVTYENGNVSKAASDRFVLDVTEPTVTTSSDFSIFSPNDDGNKDVITFRNDSSREEVWQADIMEVESGGSTGRIVKSYSFQGKVPEQIVWDGRSDEKVMAPDGRYALQLRSTDPAGNSAESEKIFFAIDTEEKPVFLSAEYDAFSPNRDGVKDDIGFLPDLRNREGIVSWMLVVFPDNGGGADIVRRFAGNGVPSTRISWNGTTESGNRAPEGSYRAELTVVYRSGDEPTAATGRFVLDVTAPEAEISRDLSVFSPNGDGRKDVVIFTQRTSEEDVWEGSVFDSSREVVKQFTWTGKAPAEFEWNGRKNDRKLATDGRYSYRLSSTDKAGNTGTSSAVTVSIDTRETPVYLSTDIEAFSPNGDGVKEGVSVVPRVKEPAGIESWKIEVSTAAGRVVKRTEGRRSVPDTITWKGKDDKEELLPDGQYNIALEVVYEHGNIATAKTGPVTLDTTPPTIRLNSEYVLFSPNGDNRKDSVPFEQSSSREELWTGKITNEEGEIVKTYTWKGRAEPFAWDGTDELGNKVKNGEYTYSAASTDAAGNSVTATELVTVDNRYTYGFITINHYGFSPNGDNVLDTVILSPTVGLKDGIASWRVELIHGRNGLQKRFSGSASPPPRSISWDGKSESGRIIEGTYTARFRIEYAKGDLVEVDTKPFELDISPPAVDVSFSPQPFSPDNDGVDDELKIGLSTEEASSVEEWTFRINDPTGRRFYTFSGTDTPAEELIWDGKAYDGELVQSAEDYPYELYIKDSLGNADTSRGKISIDVLVIREDGKLKIRISSINFMPNRAELVTVEQDEELYEKNNRVLDLLAEKLKKYNTYNIRLEGHAVSVYWDQPERAAREEKEELQPLSLARAESVKQALTQRGIAAGRMSVAGLGGTRPIVPHGDLENRWKNRRVEFILIK
jgi:flagellar hook assembly protein FlgD/outer membrane protein OmpA-like peptidoglycan-associated protein